MLIRTWGARHGVPMVAILELEQLLGEGARLALVEQGEDAPGSESRQQSLIRLEAASKDVMLFRNNVGAFQTDTGQWVRYGLANESAKQNKLIKSADLIGWRSFIIRPQHVGLKCAQFVSREVKKLSWNYDPNDPHTRAQTVWRDLVNSYGGDAAFANGPGTL